MSDSPYEHTSSKEPLSWDVVWNDELKQIDLRRKVTRERDEEERGEAAAEPQVHSSSARAAAIDADNPESALQAVTERALKMNLVGLAFSGGGIRSATFNLGLLQGLAELKLLKHIDYLSTVSGGGYIGSWLTTLIRRQRGIKEAEELLHPIRRQQPASVVKADELTGREREQEPEPVAHLRAYSNYLAPKIGMLSQDSLSLVAAYVRNLVASLLVLLPALIGAIAAIRLGHAAFLSKQLMHIACAPEIAATLTVGVMSFVLLLMGAAVGRIREIRRHQEKEQVPVAHQVHLSPGIYTITVSLLVMSAALAVWLLSSRDNLADLWGFDLAGLVETPLRVILFFAGLAAVSYVGQELWQGLDRFRWGTAFARAAGGAAGGTLVYFVVEWQFWGEGFANQSFDFVAGIPIMLLTWILASKIAIALAGNDIREDEREWWGRMAGTTARAALLWLVVTGLTIFGPAIVEQSGYWARGTVTAGWLLSTIGALVAGRSGKKQDKPQPARRLALAAVPYIFLIGLVSGLALAVSSAIDEPPPDLPPGESMTLLERLVNYEGRLDGTCPGTLLAILAGSAVIGAYASRRIDVNSTSLNSLYANRLTRCYLGASRAKEYRSESFGRAVSKDKPRRQPHPWTGFDPLDDLPLCDLVVNEQRGKDGYDGPFHIINTAINLAGAKSIAQQDRKANSFTLTPLACGNPRLGFRPTAESRHGHLRGTAAT